MKFQSREKASAPARLRQFVWPRSGFKRAWTYLLYRMARMKASPHKLALGFAIGAFASFTPLLGLHIILAAALAFLLRANVIASAIGTALGNPLTLPLMWVASYDLGAWILRLDSQAPASFGGPPNANTGGIAHDWSLTALRDGWTALEPFIWPLMLGSVILGSLFGLLFYVIIRRAVMRIQASRPVPAKP
ncbi:MAG: DUF2062 domain-containing protein [Proteobacteria bacterium]|nr:DUF2062 domain-containing protein [Pseudomonadota bacterium]